MKLEYDPEADAAYLSIKEEVADGEAARTVEVTDDVMLDFDREGRLLGIEVLNASRVLGKKVLAEAQPVVQI